MTTVAGLRPATVRSWTHVPLCSPLPMTTLRKGIPRRLLASRGTRSKSWVEFTARPPTLKATSIQREPFRRYKDMPERASVLPRNPRVRVGRTVVVKVTNRQTSPSPTTASPREPDHPTIQTKSRLTPAGLKQPWAPRFNPLFLLL